MANDNSFKKCTPELLFLIKTIDILVWFMTYFSHMLALFWWTVIHYIHKTQWFPLSMLMFSQESCFFGHSIFEIPLWPKWKCYFRMDLNPLRKVKAQACSHGLMTSLFRLDLTGWYPPRPEIMAQRQISSSDFSWYSYLVFCVYNLPLRFTSFA